MKTLAAILADPRLEQRVRLGAGLLLRYTLVFLMLLWGSFKFFAFEAEAIQPLAENSPLTGWLYPLLGVRGTSALFGATQVPAAILIAAWRWLPRASAIASLFAAAMLLTTLSFIVSTPAAELAPFRGFLMKDAVLLGAALYTAAESLAAARRRDPGLG